MNMDYSKSIFNLIQTKSVMQPDYSYLISQTGIELPLIGFYDSPELKEFEPIVEPVKGARACLFAFFKQWKEGKTLRISKQNYGCGGAGSWLFDVKTRTRQQYIEFLVDEEGLKHNYELMDQWLNATIPYKPEYQYLYIGPLKPELYKYLKTISFIINPDQLSMLVIAVQYHSRPDDEPPLIAPFGSGCMQLVSKFKNLDTPQAMLGGTDMAMRQYLPPEKLVFTMTKSMFERVCEINSDSFLAKSFIQRLRKAREKQYKPDN
jgi:hypothetical protein